MRLTIKTGPTVMAGLLTLVIGCRNLQAQFQPKFVTYVLAGRDMRKSKISDQMTAIYDKKKGYYLINDTDAKTAYSLLLVKPQELKDDPTDILQELKVRNGVLPSLSTGHGVSIGDSERNVIRKLGKPTQRDKIGKDSLLFYIYDGGRIYGWSFSSWYTIRGGKVSSIRLDLQEGKELAG
jgi:hypothetical protein